MAEEVFDLYDREKLLLAEGQAILESGDQEAIKAFAERLFDRFSKLVRENEDLTRHSDRQEQRLVKLNRNLKTQTLELEQQRSRLEGLSLQLAKYLPPQIHDALFAGKYSRIDRGNQSGYSRWSIDAGRSRRQSEKSTYC